jgi:hypothetical protein
MRFLLLCCWGKGISRSWSELIRVPPHVWEFGFSQLILNQIICLKTNEGAEVARASSTRTGTSLLEFLWLVNDILLIFWRRWGNYVWIFGGKHIYRGTVIRIVMRLEIFSFFKYFNLFTKMKNSYIILGMSTTYNYNLLTFRIQFLLRTGIINKFFLLTDRKGAQCLSPCSSTRAKNSKAIWSLQ